jgi:hypothetical protein
VGYLYGIGPSETRSMSAWSVDLAKQALNEFRPSGANREVADYWLSLWKAQSPPTREQFDPKSVAKHLSGIAIFELMPDGPIICRLAGTYIQKAVGQELTGKDLLEVTPPDLRTARAAGARMVVDGAIVFGQRRLKRFDSEEALAVDEILLPFASSRDRGGRKCLYHTEYAPRFSSLRRDGIEAPIGFAVQRIVSIRRDGE